MSEADQSEKTEEPTSKKRQDAFKEGQFAKAPEIGVVFVLASAFVVLSFTAKTKAVELSNLAVSLLGKLGEFEFTQQGITDLMTGGVQAGLWVLSPMLLATTVAAVVAGGIQSGFRITLDALQMKFDKLSPSRGFKRIFSKSSLVQFGIDGLKFIVIGYVIYTAVIQIMNDPIFYTVVPVTRLIEFILQVFIKILIRLLVFLGIIAIINYVYQRYKTTQDLKMTRQEVKDERKASEGDAFIKSRQRSAALRMMQKQMLSEVPTADVVVTNPTHFAIALKYERGVDKAPIVLAKGKNLFAQKIKEIAQKHGVPISENKIVARMLYKLGKVGSTIPAELYQVIAEILAYVYKTHKYYFHRLSTRRRQNRGTKP